MIKKLLSIFIFSACSLTASAQTLGMYRSVNGNVSTDDISGTTVQFNYSGSNYEDAFVVRNLTNTTISTKIRRVQISTPGSQIDEQVCWGELGTANGECIDFNSSNPSFLSGITVDLNTTNEGEFLVHINPNATSGTFLYRYYLEEVGTGIYHDSIDVQVTVTADVKEKSPVSISIYPNPANDFIQVALQGTTGENKVRMVDILGNVVLEEKMNQTKKFDISGLKNGVYVLTVYSNGSLMQTRRMIVKH